MSWATLGTFVPEEHAVAIDLQRPTTIGLATPEPDPTAVEAFAERIMGAFNDAGLALMTSIGHQVGLFDTLAELDPSTSHEIAGAAGLDERYVREWLAAMTVGGVLTYEPGRATFWLPPEHAAVLTRAAGPDNLAVSMQFIALLANVEPKVVECFRHGGGVSYEHFTDFHRLMAEESAHVHDTALVDVIVPLVDGLADRLSSGIRVADIGCGSGHAVNLLAKAFPASDFVGYDFSEEAIEVARREAGSLGLGNAAFEVRDVEHLGEVGQYDLVTAFDAIHDQAQPAAVLAAVHRALRPDGVFLMVDVQASSNLEENLDHPLGTAIYAISTLHCMTVSLALDGVGLGTAWGEQRARQMLSDAGFDDVTVTHVDQDIFNSYYVARRGVA